MKTKLLAVSTFLAVAAMSSIGTAWCAELAAVTDLVGHAPGTSNLQSGRSRLRTPGERPLALLAYHLG